MKKVWGIIDENLMETPPLKVERLPTFYPSSSACVDQTDNTKTVGACLRANYYRCAGYEKSNPDSLWSQYVFAGGIMWEKWILDKLKAAGVLLGSNVKFVDVDRYISGEVDGVILDPETGKKVILEMKTFYGYEAKKNLCGNRTVKPKPKDPHLLQSFLYLGHFSDQIEDVVIMYFARDDHTTTEFHVTVHEEDGKRYPKIETTWNNEPYSYIDKRISLEGIYERFDDLMETLKTSTLPPPDLMHIYPDAIVEEKWAAKEIAKTRYENWSRNKTKYPIGDFMCGTGGDAGYCSYRSMCAVQKLEDGHD